MSTVHRFHSQVRLFCMAVLAFAFVASTADAAPRSSTRKAPSQKAVVTGVVNLNTASLKELTMLPGIGKSTAEKIIAARPFQSPDHVTRVKGIGLKRYRALKDHLAVTGSTTIAVKKAPKSTQPRAKAGTSAETGEPNASRALPSSTTG